MKITNNYKIIIAFTILPFIVCRFIPREFCEKVMLLFFGIVILCYVIPDVGEFIYKAFSKTGTFIGRIISMVILFFIWIFAVLPTGCIMKIIGRDRLRLKKTNIRSYWIDNITQNTDYEYQF